MLHHLVDLKGEAAKCFRQKPIGRKRENEMQLWEGRVRFPIIQPSFIFIFCLSKVNYKQTDKRGAELNWHNSRTF